MRRCTPTLLLLILVGCGRIYAPPPKEHPPQNGAPVPKTQETNESVMQAKGVDLWLYGTAPTAGVERKPTCWVHAETFTLEKDNAWLLEEAKAVIYTQDGDQTDIHIEARHGRFEESKMAYLRDGVIANVGATHIRMDDVQWVNDERVLQTDRPASITTDDSQLDAESLRLYPDKRQIVMTRVTGTVEWEARQP